MLLHVHMTLGQGNKLSCASRTARNKTFPHAADSGLRTSLGSSARISTSTASIHHQTMKYPFVIFDFDGTLADSFPLLLRLQHEISRRHGFEPIAEHRAEELRR